MREAGWNLCQSAVKFWDKCGSVSSSVMENGAAQILTV